MPITTAFLLAAVVVVIVCRKLPFQERLNTFSRGAGNYNIMLMVWIFVLAGAFASVAKAMGAIGATVSLVMGVLPDQWLLPGLFVASCLISMSIGTSVGTIVALTPIAVGLAPEGCLTLYVAAAVGGAFFGDNLSFISDTTIMATRTQGIEMREKFLANIWFALPAAIVTLLIYICMPEARGGQATSAVGADQLLLAMPYFIVLVTALCGMNVTKSLVIGLALATAVGLGTGTMDVATLWQAMADGISGMADLILVTLLAGGIVALIRNSLEGRRWRLVPSRFGSRTAQLGLAAMVMAVDFVTANNTVAILTLGDFARGMGERCSIPARRVASILDTFSCIAQGIIPWGAQLLMAAGLASVAPSSIIPFLYYPAILFVTSVTGILLFSPKGGTGKLRA